MIGRLSTDPFRSAFVDAHMKISARASRGAVLFAVMLVTACSSRTPMTAAAATQPPAPSTAPQTTTPTMPSADSRQDVELYKTGIKQGCVNQGIQRGDAPAGIAAFCGCIADTFNRSLSPAQWQAASDAAKAMNSAEEAKVFAPYMAQAKGCKKPK
jgi:hypothetical protein